MRKLKSLLASISLIIFLGAFAAPLSLNAGDCTPSQETYEDEKNKWFGGCKDKPGHRCIIKNRCPMEIHIHVK